MRGWNYLTHLAQSKARSHHFCSITIIHFKSTQRERCVKVDKDKNASWLNLQESQVSVESTVVIFSTKNVSPPVQSTSPVHWFSPVIVDYPHTHTHTHYGCTIFRSCNYTAQSQDWNAISGFWDCANSQIARNTYIYYLSYIFHMSVQTIITCREWTIRDLDHLPLRAVGTKWGKRVKRTRRSSWSVNVYCTRAGRKQTWLLAERRRQKAVADSWIADIALKALATFMSCLCKKEHSMTSQAVFS